ncbi:hypothetical protein B0H19DRAFT_1200245 [Mycena capillaripes]|nr:hypothetical protein B0H19DRAFT_1200245 [Mycena capillaripes]
MPPLCTAGRPGLRLSHSVAAALASYRECINLKNTRKIVWRDQGQQSVNSLPTTLRECLEQAATGGTRSATLALTISSCFNLLLYLSRLRRIPRAQRITLLRRAIFGEDSFRLAATLGTFAALYKFLVNALPLIFPSSARSSTVVIGEAHDSKPGSDLDLDLQGRRVPRSPNTARTRLRRWHAALAGAIAGGLAVMWQKQGWRKLIAQEVFVRGLQGTYNTCSRRWGLTIPYGAEILFALASGQILYGFFLRPDTLPRSYVNWIQSISGTPPGAFPFNRKVVQENVFDIEMLDGIIASPNVTSRNLDSLLSLRERILAGEPDIPRYLPCCGLHPHFDSCVHTYFILLFQVARQVIPLYTARHLTGIVLRFKIDGSYPGMILRTGFGIMRSCVFLGAAVVLSEAIWCVKHRLYEWLMEAPASSVLRQIFPQHMIDMLISRYSWWSPGLLVSLALVFEDKRRRTELTMYVLPKAMESMWIMARGRGLVGSTGSWGESVLAAIGTSMLMTTYEHNPEHLSGLVRKVLYQIA